MLKRFQAQQGDKGRINLGSSQNNMGKETKNQQDNQKMRNIEDFIRFLGIDLIGRDFTIFFGEFFP